VSAAAAGADRRGGACLQPAPVVPARRMHAAPARNAGASTLHGPGLWALSARAAGQACWKPVTVKPSMVGGVRFGACSGPGGTGGIAPRCGRFGPPGTARADRRVRPRAAAAHAGVARTNVFADVPADGALHALHVAVPADVAERVALALRRGHELILALA
jgi:hypothetical protein